MAEESNLTPEQVIGAWKTFGKEMIVCKHKDKGSIKIGDNVAYINAKIKLPVTVGNAEDGVKEYRKLYMDMTESTEKIYSTINEPGERYYEVIKLTLKAMNDIDKKKYSKFGLACKYINIALAHCVNKLYVDEVLGGLKAKGVKHRVKMEPNRDGSPQYTFYSESYMKPGEDGDEEEVKMDSPSIKVVLPTMFYKKAQLADIQIEKYTYKHKSGDKDKEAPFYDKQFKIPIKDFRKTKKGEMFDADVGGKPVSLVNVQDVFTRNSEILTTVRFVVSVSGVGVSLKAECANFVVVKTAKFSTVDNTKSYKKALNLFGYDAEAEDSDLDQDGVDEDHDDKDVEDHDNEDEKSKTSKMLEAFEDDAEADADVDEKQEESPKPKKKKKKDKKEKKDKKNKNESTKKKVEDALDGVSSEDED